MRMRAVVLAIGWLCVSFHGAVAETKLEDAPAKWTVPLAGNTFVVQPGRLPLEGREAISLAAPSGEAANRSDPNDATLAVYFHLSSDANVELVLQRSGDNGGSGDKTPCEILVSLAGEERKVTSEGGDLQLGTFDVSAGYAELLLTPVRGRAQFSELEIQSSTAGLKVDAVFSNAGNMFYWGRRGPSVHLNYQIDSNEPIDYAYTEITVPRGADTVGSFFMANGFGEGYFGFQVNSERERRVLFSVWSPFKTDDPREIPPEDRIACLASGAEVHVGKFGNEGSGGQSYLRHHWQAGRTYRFLTRVTPQSDAATRYTAWFGDVKSDEWLLIASFARPKTQKHLTRFHSFLENFQPSTGHISRMANYSNVWVRSVGGKWTQCTTAKFSMDATGRGRHRLDFAGGVEGNAFYLKNCGFFNAPAPASVLNRASSGQPPKIDFDLLESLVKKNAATR